MTIRLLQNKDINKQRWDQTIINSPNGLIYAHSIYLDHMCKGWSALANEDYSLLMPLAIKRKWRISYLTQPPFCQQSGVFGTASITREVMCAFVEKAQQQCRFAEIYINYQNIFEHPDGLIQHRNYVLDLNRDYESIRENYTNNLLKKSLRRIGKFPLIYSNSADIENAVRLYRQLYGDRMPHVTESDYAAFIALSHKLFERGQACVREVKLENGELLACGLFFKDSKRIYNIISATLPNGRTFEANYFLFDNLVMEFAGKNLLLDFEGSDLPGVERFYQKFGPVDQPYYFLKWNKLPWPARLFKK